MSCFLRGLALAIIFALGSVYAADESYDKVKHAPAFAIGGVGIAGIMTPEEGAMRTIRDGTKGANQFRSLVKDGTQAGRMYAFVWPSPIAGFRLRRAFPAVPVEQRAGATHPRLHHLHVHYLGSGEVDRQIRPGNARLGKERAAAAEVSATGAMSLQPGATPQDSVRTEIPALKARLSDA